MNCRSFLFSLMLLFFALGLGGCIDIEEHYTLNPDGSGKVRFVWHGKWMEEGKSTMFGLGLGAGDGSELVSLIDQSYGVEAWSELAYSASNDGSFTVSVVAYFSDFEDLQLSFGGTDIHEFERSFSEDGKRLTIRMGSKVEAEESESGFEEEAVFPSRDQITEGEIKERMKQIKQEFRTERSPVFRDVLSNLSIVQTFELEGEASIEGFEKESGRFRYQFVGEDLLDRLYRLYEDEAFLRELALAELTGESLDTNRLIEEKLGETPSVLEAELSGYALFDYEVEVSEAKAAFPELMASLGIGRSPGALLESNSENGFESVQLVGFELKRLDLLRELGLNSVGEDALTLTLLARLKEPVDWIGEGRLTEAVDQAGEAMMSKHWAAELSNVRENSDNTAVVFTVSLQPNEDTERIASLSGYFECVEGSGTEWKSLGFDRIAKGQVGAMAGVRVESVGESRWEDGYTIELAIPFDLDEVKGFRGVLPDGSYFALRQSGSSTWGSRTSVDLQSSVQIPERMDVEVSVVANQVRYRSDFRIEDIPLPSGLLDR